jgi:hypothetical protein
MDRNLAGEDAGMDVGVSRRRWVALGCVNLGDTPFVTKVLWPMGLESGVSVLAAERAGRGPQSLVVDLRQP